MSFHVIAAMRKPLELQRIDAGLYIDGAGGCYLCPSEFLVANGLPPAPEIRAALLEEITLGFPEIICIEFSD
jgi:hypothetical protein